MVNYDLHYKLLHEQQIRFVESKAKRKIIRAGRRGGKTVGASQLAGHAFVGTTYEQIVNKIEVDPFEKGGRILYAAPTEDQVSRFWFEVVSILWEPIEAGVLRKNETKHIIELPGTEFRIRAKTAWNADSLRGDSCSLLILDEWQLMNEDAWAVVGAPMLLDNDGDAVFIYTPPSMRTRSVTKAYDPLHAAKLYKKAAADKTGRWEAFHFTSYDNPFISQAALADIAGDMSALAIRQEIEAEDIDEIPGALWTYKLIEATRVSERPKMSRIVIGVDPQGKKKDSAETGIVGSGKGVDGHGYVLCDYSINGTPNEWGRRVIMAYYDLEADLIAAEANYGGEMVKEVIHGIDPDVPVKLVNASRGKIVRAEPVSSKWEKGEGHMVGTFPELEDEMCSFTPESSFSPNRFDAMVWSLTELLIKGHSGKTMTFDVISREGTGIF